MNTRIAIGFAIASLAGAMVGCAAVPATQVGLSNAASLNRGVVPGDSGHDAIANGPDSCERVWTSERDPIPYRTLQCVEAEPVAHITPTSSMPVAAGAPASPTDH